MRRRLELRDLRSLERRSMYSIFHPLDPNERLPRELLVESRRYRWFDLGGFLTLLGVLYLPALMLMVVVLVGFNVNPIVAFAAAGVGLLAVYFFAVSARDP